MEEETAAVEEEAGVIDNWNKDGDKMLNEREYSDGIFNLWDSDADGTLTNDEYTTSNDRYYGTM